MNTPAEPLSLSPAERKDLKARAHHLKPVVMIGESGLSASVLAETDRALSSHELIKVRVLGDDREQRQAMMHDLCAALGCAPVQMIGKLLVVYRPGPESDAAGAGTSTGRRPRGPHRPKKTLGARAETGANKPPVSPPRRAAKTPTAAAKGAATVATKARAGRSAAAAPRSKAGRAGTAGASGSLARKSLSARTAGKRTDLGAAARPPARKSRASTATQGPSRLQGKPGPRTGGRRDRAKGGKG